MCECAFIVSNVSFPTAVPPVILRLAEPEQRLDTCIEFTVRGYPQPQLRWFHKQKEIIKNDYIRTEMDFYQDYLEGCLTFQNPTHINNGNYTLEASNALGTVTKTVYGHFLENPDEPGEWITTFYRHFILGGDVHLAALIVNAWGKGLYTNDISAQCLCIAFLHSSAFK